MSQQPTIDAYEFGRLTIRDQAYTSDVLLLPTGVHKNWQRDEGHVLKPQDLEAIIEARPSVLIIGIGAYESMKVTDETMARLQQADIEVICLPTTEAVGAYNERCDKGEAVAAALHLTC